MAMGEHVSARGQHLGTAVDAGVKGPRRGMRYVLLRQFQAMHDAVIRAGEDAGVYSKRNRIPEVEQALQPVIEMGSAVLRKIKSQRQRLLAGLAGPSAEGEQGGAKHEGVERGERGMVDLAVELVTRHLGVGSGSNQRRRVGAKVRVDRG